LHLKIKGIHISKELWFSSEENVGLIEMYCTLYM
jgi:hypothetical protein